MQIPVVKPQDGPKTYVFKLNGTASLGTPDDVCLTLRVYTHAASDPKKLTGYTECQKADRHGVKNAVATPRLIY